MRMVKVAWELDSLLSQVTVLHVELVAEAFPASHKLERVCDALALAPRVFTGGGFRRLYVVKPGETARMAIRSVGKLLFCPGC